MNMLAGTIRTLVALVSSALMLGVLTGRIGADVGVLAAFVLTAAYMVPLPAESKPVTPKANYPLIELMEHEDLGVSIELMDDGTWKELPVKRTVGEWEHSDTCPTCEVEKHAAEYATRSRQDKQMADMKRRRAELEQARIKEPGHEHCSEKQCDCAQCLSAWFIAAAHMATRGRNGSVRLRTEDALRLKTYDLAIQRSMIKAITELFAEVHPAPQVEEALRRVTSTNPYRIRQVP